MNHNPNITTTKTFRHAIALGLGLLLFVFAMQIWAHGGFDHVIGTVVKVENNTMTVKTAKGDVDVMLNPQTEITKADLKAGVADLKPGARVVVDIPEGSKDRIAHSVKVGVVAHAAHGTH